MFLPGQKRPTVCMRNPPRAKASSPHRSAVESRQPTSTTRHSPVRQLPTPLAHGPEALVNRAGNHDANRWFTRRQPASSTGRVCSVVLSCRAPTRCFMRAGQGAAVQTKVSLCHRKPHSLTPTLLGPARRRCIAATARTRLGVGARNKTPVVTVQSWSNVNCWTHVIIRRYSSARGVGQ